MCTIGAKIFEPGQEFVLFKNRDFTRTSFDDTFAREADHIGVMGVETWDNDGTEADLLSGFSIGYNAHLACCDSNVRSILQGENYDKLVQAVVQECASVDEAEQLLRDLVQTHHFHWANLLVATAHQVAAFEVHDQQVTVLRDDVSVVRANHHVMPGPSAEDDDTQTTAIRHKLAEGALRTANHLGDIFSILKIHGREGVGVCNHSLYQTVSSYVVHWRAGQVTFYHHAGKPCDGKAYQRMLGGTPS
jgi:hypothetical protein